MNDEEQKQKKYRHSYPRPDYSESYWSKMLEKDDVADPTSRLGKQFRRRFGIPFALYQRIVTDAAVWFPPKPNAFGQLN